MCKIGHRTGAKKSLIMSMPRQQVLYRMLKMKSLCLTTKNSSTTRKKRSFPRILLVSATFTVSSNKSIRKSIISPYSMYTRQSRHIRKTSSQSITMKSITSKSVIRSCRDSLTWKVLWNYLEIKSVTRLYSVIRCAHSVNKSIWSVRIKIKI